MHVVHLIEPGVHPDTPAPPDLHTIKNRLWSVYIDGRIFLRTPDREDARHAQKVALDSQRYEYVDLILEEDRRSEEDRRTGEWAPWKAEQPRRRNYADRRQS